MVSNACLNLLTDTSGLGSSVALSYCRDLGCELKKSVRCMYKPFSFNVARFPKSVSNILADQWRTRVTLSWDCAAWVANPYVEVALDRLAG